MSSTKSSIGHLLGAAGAVEAIFCLLAMRDETFRRPSILDNPSVATAIDLVPHKARKRPINIALSNSFGFGGTNASPGFPPAWRNSAAEHRSAIFAPHSACDPLPMSLGDPSYGQARQILRPFVAIAGSCLPKWIMQLIKVETGGDRIESTARRRRTNAAQCATQSRGRADKPAAQPPRVAPATSDRPVRPAAAPSTSKPVGTAAGTPSRSATPVDAWIVRDAAPTRASSAAASVASSREPAKAPPRANDAPASGQPANASGAPWMRIADPKRITPRSSTNGDRARYG